MARLSIDEQIEKQEQLVDKCKLRLKAEQKKLKSLKHKKSEQERKIDTRRKVLLGALVMNHLEHSQGLQDWVLKNLPEFLSRESDQQLFDELLAEYSSEQE